MKIRWCLFTLLAGVSLLLASPVSAAPTLSQQVTFADGLVKMAEGMNDGCAVLLSAYDGQVDSTKPVTDDDQVFGSYFGCAMSSMFSFYAEHWAPSAALKNVQTKMVKLSDGLSGSLRYVWSDATSTDYLPFKENVEKNKTLIASVKKEMATFKKKNPAAAKSDAAFLKKIDSKQKDYSSSGDIKVSCGKDESCFEKLFAQCKSGWLRYPAGTYNLEYKIIGKVKGGCKMQVSEKIDWLGLLSGKSMTCVYNNKNDFYEEVGRVGDELLSGKSKICSGSMVGYVQKQYKMLRSNPFGTMMLDLNEKIDNSLADLLSSTSTTDAAISTSTSI